MVSMSLSAGFGRVWMMVAAAFDFTIAALVLAHWPSTAAWILGLYLGVSFMFSGLGLVFAALGARQN